MSSWVTPLLDESSVLWDPPTLDGRGGYVWGDSININSRWEYQVQSTGPTTKYTESGAVPVFRTSVWVSIPVKVGSYLFNGLLSSIAGDANPDTLEDTHRVATISTVRGISSNIVLYKVYLDED